MPKTLLDRTLEFLCPRKVSPQTLSLMPKTLLDRTLEFLCPRKVSRKPHA